MPNDFFEFKEFRIQQDRCAMKVTTDACIFGAWVPVANEAKHALDLGAGTGILSLMQAQRYPELRIDAVEIDAEAAAQAAQNVSASPFADRVRVIQADARNLRFQKKYDLLISNPPFFSESLQSGDEKRMQARHGNTLPLHDLIKIAGDALAPDGAVATIWPAEEYSKWKAFAAANSFYPTTELCIHSVRAAKCTRMASVFSRGCNESTAAFSETLFVTEKDGDYSARFKRLLRPFYLKL